MQATESSGKSDTVKSSILLHCTGSKSREIYNAFTFAEQGDNMKFDKILLRSLMVLYAKEEPYTIEI